MTAVPVLCAVQGVAETAVVRALAARPAELAVARRCADLAELLAAGAAGLGRVAVVSADLPGVAREAVEHLQLSGLWVLVLADDAAGWSPARADRLGADAVLPVGQAEVVADAVLELLGRVAAGGRPGVGSPIPGAARALAPGAARTPVGEPGGPAAVDPSGVSRSSDPAGRLRRTRPAGGAAGLDPAAPSAVEPLVSRRVPGRMVAVWGPTGAPGRTTVALTLAAELAASVEGGALLVDADTYGGSVAPLLGLLDEAPGVAAACRAAGTGRLDAVALAALTPRIEPGLRVLTGISRAERWTEVPSASLEAVWAAARDLAPWTVVDCGFSLEQDEVLTYDTRAPQRNAATLSALAAADVVVAVGSGDPLGLQRLVRGLDDLAEVVTTAERAVVVNRVRASASGLAPASAVRSALARYAGVHEVTIVPEDRDACDGAVLMARTLQEHAPASPVRRALATFADQLRGAAAPAGPPGAAH